MVKSKLNEITKDFIEKDKKSQKNNSISETNEAESTKMTTLYLKEKVSKLLWHHKVDTGETLSATVNRLVLKEFKNNS